MKAPQGALHERSAWTRRDRGNGVVMEDRKEPFATFVLEALADRGAELARRWARHTRHVRHARRAATPFSEVPASAGESPASSTSAGSSGPSDDGPGQLQLVQTVLAAAANGAQRDEPLRQAGAAMGADAHRRNASLHLMLEEVDLLGALMLRGAEEVAADYSTSTTGRDGLAVARRIAGVTSQLRLAATAGYAQAIEDELRERYRAIRHDLRNPLGTIKTAVALLTDKSIPAETRASARVRAMVVRNTSSLDQMISEALGDAAARLRAFERSREISPDTAADSPIDSPSSDGEQGDDLTRSRQRPDLESGAL